MFDYELEKKQRKKKKKKVSGADLEHQIRFSIQLIEESRAEGDRLAEEEDARLNGLGSIKEDEEEGFQEDYAEEEQEEEEVSSSRASGGGADAAAMQDLRQELQQERLRADRMSMEKDIFMSEIERVKQEAAAEKKHSEKYMEEEINAKAAAAVKARLEESFKNVKTEVHALLKKSSQADQGSISASAMLDDVLSCVENEQERSNKAVGAMGVMKLLEAPSRKEGESLKHGGDWKWAAYAARHDGNSGNSTYDGRDGGNGQALMELENKIEELRRKLEEEKVERRVAEDKLTTAEAKREKLKAEKKELKAKTQRTEMEIEEAKRRIMELEASVASAGGESSPTSASERMSKLKSRAERAESEVEKLLTENLKLSETMGKAPSVSPTQSPTVVRAENSRNANEVLIKDEFKRVKAQLKALHSMRDALKKEADDNIQRTVSFVEKSLKKFAAEAVQQTKARELESAVLRDGEKTARDEERKINAQVKGLQEELTSKNGKLMASETALESAEVMVKKLERDAAMNDEKMKALEAEVGTLRSRNSEQMMARNSEQMSMDGKMKSLQEKLSAECDMVESLRSDLLAAESSLKELKDTSKNAKSVLADMEAKAKHYQKKAKQAKAANSEAIKKITPAVAQIRNMHSSLKTDATKALSTWAEMMVEMSASVRRLHNIDLVAAATTVQDHVTLLNEKKKLLNYIQELRGNIRVYCRVRPMWPNEQTDGSPSVVNFADKQEMVLSNIDDEGKVTKKTFEFDHVFDDTASQDQVFMEILPMIQSALDGYNICIFAYGQTGSGKTHTMQGPGDGPNRGVIYRVLEELFKLKDDSWIGIEYRFEMSMLEIYNEQIIDILNTETKKQKGDKALLTAEKGKKNTLEIKMAEGGGTYVSGLQEQEVSSKEEVLALMAIGQTNRTVAATAMNSSSSRSHLAVCIKIAALNKATDVTRHSKINLIDLAGSERVNRSEVQGDRLKEAQAINKSLSCLGDVIYSLGSKSGHVPYRNSKLTHLLSDSLGGNSKVLMFVNISPTRLSFQETISSLLFATRVRSVALGTASRQKGEKGDKAGKSAADGAKKMLSGGYTAPAASRGGGGAPPPPPPPPGPPEGAPGGRATRKKKIGRS